MKQGCIISGTADNVGNGSGEESDCKDDEVQASFERELSAEGARDDTFCRQREKERQSELDPAKELDKQRKSKIEESQINQLPVDEDGNEICSDDEGEGYANEHTKVFHGDRGSSKRRSPELSEAADHLLMERQSKGSATTSNCKTAQLTKLWRDYALGKGRNLEESFSRGQGEQRVELDDDDDTPSPNSKATNSSTKRSLAPETAAEFSETSVGNLQDLGTVLSLPETLTNTSCYWSQAFFRCASETGVGTLRWTGGKRDLDAKIQHKTLLGNVGSPGVAFFIEDATVFVGQGCPEYKRWCTDTGMALLGQAVARSSLGQGNQVPEKKKVPSVWMDTFLATNCRGRRIRQMDQSGGGNAVWEEFGRRFRGDKMGIGTCGMIFFAINSGRHWTLLAGNTNTRAWTWFDGYEPVEYSCRKSGRKAPANIQKLKHQLSYVMNRAAIEYPDIQGYQKFKGTWTLETIHADKIPVQAGSDDWSCGIRVLLLADMLASGYHVSDMLNMYGHDDMPAIHVAMGGFALGLMQDATPKTRVDGKWVTSSWL
jgi:hypothetical protein